MRLFHYACRDHTLRALGDRGVLRPARHPSVATSQRVLWLTDMDPPERDALGLTSEVFLKCDRLEVRYVVETDSAIPWNEWKVGRVPPSEIALLESCGAQPSRWFVSTVSVLGVRDRSYQPKAVAR